MKNIYPKKVKNEYGEIQNSKNLLKEQELQIGLSERETTKIKGIGYVILDYGKELCGGVRILTYHAGRDKKIRLRFGESLTECCAEIGEKNATNDHSLRDTIVELQDFSDMSFGQTGFRFVRIDTLNEDAEIELKSIVAVSSEDEREQVGKFESDDETINEIWTTASYTLKLCLQNGYYWDGIKRDRLVWIGDVYPEMKAAQSLYGTIPETERSLRYAKEQTPLGDWINGIPMYSMWWLIILSDHYLYGGDRRFVEEQLAYAEELISEFEKYVDEEGETHFEYNFIDWPTHYEGGKDDIKQQDEKTGVNYLLRIALQKTGTLMKALGRKSESCERLLQKLSKKQCEVKKYKQIASLGVWSGERTENNREVLLRNGAEGMSTFMSYEILTSCAMLGEYENALQMMKEYYGGMLKLGATTFWEDFDVKWLERASRIDEQPKQGEKDVHGDCGAFCYKGFRHSFCHGWSSGVIAYLTEQVLGIKAEEVGFRKVRIEPHLSGLRHVKGSCPTPFGVIEVEYNTDETGRIEKRIKVPSGIEIAE